jgi:hypothetical protein
MAVALFCFRRDVKTIRAKNLELTGATMSHSLEASLVFNDSLAANETLATLGKQGQFAEAEVLNAMKNVLPTGHGTLKIIPIRWARWSAAGCSQPVAQPIMHNGNKIGEIRLTARDSLISHFIWMSFAVLTGCILLPLWSH